MLSPRDIDTAVSRKIITMAQRDALLTLSLSKSETIEAVETPDEELRLVGGGNDIFVTIGILLFLAGATFALSSIFTNGPSPIVGIAALSILVIAEIVTRQRRMRLSSTPN